MKRVLNLVNILKDQLEKQLKLIELKFLNLKTDNKVLLEQLE